MDLTIAPVTVALVDRLAAIKAEIARLTTESDNIKDALIDSGLTAIDGTLHRAAIVRCEGRTFIDWRAIAERLNPSRQLITAHTTVGDPVVSVRLTARKPG